MFCAYSCQMGTYQGSVRLKSCDTSLPDMIILRQVGLAGGYLEDILTPPLGQLCNSAPA